MNPYEPHTAFIPDSMDKFGPDGPVQYRHIGPLGRGIAAATLSVLLVAGGCSSGESNNTQTPTTAEAPATADDIEPIEAGGLIFTGEYISPEPMYSAIDYSNLETVLATIGEPKPQTSSDVREVMKDIFYNLTAAAIVGPGPISEKFQEKALLHYPEININPQVIAVEGKREHNADEEYGDKLVFIRLAKVTGISENPDGSVNVAYDFRNYESVPNVATVTSTYKGLALTLAKGPDGVWKIADEKALVLPSKPNDNNEGLGIEIYKFDN